MCCKCTLHAKHIVLCILNTNLVGLSIGLSCKRVQNPWRYGLNSTFASYVKIRQGARRKLPRMLFEYIDGGSYSEETLSRNVSAFREVLLSQRVMVDVSGPVLSKRLFNIDFSMPVALGPVGLAGLFARRGEVQAAKSATNAQIPMCLSSVAICGLEEVIGTVGTSPWLQLYLIKDRSKIEKLMELAQSLGVKVLVFTVDLPVSALRLRDFDTGLQGSRTRRNLSQLLDGISHPTWLWNVGLMGRPHSFGNFERNLLQAKVLSEFWSWVGSNFEPQVTWDDISWLRRNWEGTIIIKGVMHPDDAIRAIDFGVDGIVVSNHGGRQLDGADSSLSALRKIVYVTNGQVPILFDGGIRSGTDVFKALSLGADICLLGRLWAMALAAGGEKGVTSMLDYLRLELKTCMALSGCKNLSELKVDRTAYSPKIGVRAP